ncbi:hypothetical protein D3C85_1823610 [compost metagenome]
MAKARGLAESQRLGNPIDRQLIFAEHLLGLLKAQLIEQFLIAAAQVLQMSTQRARRAVQLFGQPIQARRRAKLRRE